MNHDIEDADPVDRVAAVMGKFSECASVFGGACDKHDFDLAQQAAMGSLWTIGRLFPADNAAAHDLLLSMIGMILGARWGRREHLLLKPVQTIKGTRKGFGHAYLAAFGIAAVSILVRDGMSERAAYEHVAQFLGDQACSVRTGDHGEPVPISPGAIRGWCESRAEVHEMIAAELVIIHSGKLKEQGAITMQAVVEYLRAEAAHVVRRSKIF